MAPAPARLPRRILLPLFFVALAAVLYWAHHGAFSAPFYFDTVYHVEDKLNYHMVELSWEALRRAVVEDVGSNRLYRPVSGLSLALTHYWFRLDPWFYRAGNLAIHYLASCALFFLFTSVLASPRIAVGRAREPWAIYGAAALGVALWSLHPVHTNVVSYVIQRMASLAGLFSFLSVGAYIRARGAAANRAVAWATASGLAGALAVGSKESALVLPVLFLAVEATLFPMRRTRRQKVTLLSLAAVGVGLAAALLVWKGPAFWSTMEAAYVLRSYSPVERLLTQLHVQAQYVTLLLIPDPRLLTIEADIPVARGLLDPPATLGLFLGLAGCLLLAVLTRRRKPLLALAVFWFLGAQLVEGTILPLELYFEHRLYIPSVLLYMGLATVVVRVLRDDRGSRVVAAVLLACFLTGEVAATSYRTRFWANPILLYDDLVAKSPTKPRSYQNLSHWLMQAGLFDEAEEALLRAQELGGNPDNILFNLGTLYYRRGDMEQGEQYLRRVVALETSQAWRALRTIAYGKYLQGDHENAEKVIDQALTRQPMDPLLHVLRADILTAQKRYDEASEEVQIALRLDRTNAEAWSAKGAIELATGRREAARVSYRQAMTLNPHSEQYRAVWEALAGTAAAPKGP